MKRFIVFLTLTLLSNLTYSQDIAFSLDGVDQEIKNLIESYNAVGVSVAVVENDSIIYSKGFGYRNLEKHLPVTTQTIFPIGSITKSFTASLLGILESKEKLSFKDKPSLYIPNFRFYNEEMNNLIAIEDLLSHKSGIGNQGTSEVFFPDEDKLKVVQRLKYLKPEDEIKNSFSYSNMSYTLAGTIAEQITGKSWEIDIEEQLFRPLGMNHSFTNKEEMIQTNNYSLPYGIFEDKSEQVTFENFNSISPAGAIKSNILDLSRWMITWLNQGMFQDRQIIPQSFVHKATRPQNFGNTDYDKNAFLFAEGFGWNLRSSYGNFRAGHGGNTFGFSTNLIMFPFEGIGIVVLTNQDSSYLPHMISELIARRIFGIEPESNYPVVLTEIYKPNEKNETINQDKPPTHQLESYSGIYKANGFGAIKVITENDKLYAVLPTYKFNLAHLNYNSFYLKATEEFKGVYDPEFTVKFDVNTKREISVLKLYSQKKPIEFIKD